MPIKLLWVRSPFDPLLRAIAISPPPAPPQLDWVAGSDDRENRGDDAGSSYTRFSTPDLQHPADFILGLATQTRSRPRVATLPVDNAHRPLCPARVTEPALYRGPACGYLGYCNVEGWSEFTGIPPIEDGVRICLLSSSTPWPSGKLALSEWERLMASLMDRCYADAAQVVSLASNMAFLAASLVRLTHERTVLTPKEIDEVQHRTLSTARLYGTHWPLFTAWCGDRVLVPCSCSVSVVVKFLQGVVMSHRLWRCLRRPS